MKKIVFLASGNGGNLKFLYLCIKYNFVPEFKLYVISDRNCGSLDFAKKNGIDNHQISYLKSSPDELRNLLSEINPDIIVTNWHKIIDSNTVSMFRGKLINLHYSLLPAFSGLIGVNPILGAYKQGCKFIGPTCHFVDEGVDTGKIISQAVFLTDISQDEAIVLMFRRGCFVLLNSIFDILKITNNIQTNDNCYSPTLNFDINIYHEDFWRELEAL